MTTTDTPRAQAVAWLVGRLRFERLLTDLHRLDDADASVDLRVDATTSAKAA